MNTESLYYMLHVFVFSKTLSFGK